MRNTSLNAVDFGASSSCADGSGNLAAYNAMCALVDGAGGEMFWPPGDYSIPCELPPFPANVTLRGVPGATIFTYATDSGNGITPHQGSQAYVRKRVTGITFRQLSDGNVGSRSSIACQLTLDGGVTVPAGSRIRRAGVAWIEYKLRSAVSSTTPGSYAATFDSVDAGYFQAPLGQMTRIAPPDATVGWTAVTNTSAIASPNDPNAGIWPGAAINLVDGTGMRVDRCAFQGGWRYGVSVDGPSDVRIERNLFQNSSPGADAAYGIMISSAGIRTGIGHGACIGVWLRDNSYDGPDVPIWALSGTGVHLDGEYAIFNGYCGVRIGAPTQLTISRSVVYVSGAPKATPRAIYLLDASAQMIAWRDNYEYGCGTSFPGILLLAECSPSCTEYVHSYGQSGAVGAPPYIHSEVSDVNNLGTTGPWVVDNNYFPTQVPFSGYGTWPGRATNVQAGVSNSAGLSINSGANAQAIIDGQIRPAADDAYHAITVRNATNKLWDVAYDGRSITPDERMTEKRPMYSRRTGKYSDNTSTKDSLLNIAAGAEAQTFCTMQPSNRYVLVIARMDVRVSRDDSLVQCAWFRRSQLFAVDGSGTWTQVEAIADDHPATNTDGQFPAPTFTTSDEGGPIAISLAGHPEQVSHASGKIWVEAFVR